MDLTSLIKFFGVPGSLTFLALNVTVALGLLFFATRFRPLGQVWLWVTVILYWALSLPIVAGRFVDALVSPAARMERTPVDVLLVFDGDNRRGRVAETCRLLEARPVPVWILGQEWMIPRLLACGVDPAALRHETGVSNTRDQIDWVVLFVREHPDSRVAVVASRLQMPRVRALADAQNLRVAFVAAPIDTDPASVGWRRLWPSYAALRASRDAIYEHAALAYYRWRGWIAGNDAVTGAASAVEWPGR